MTDWIPMPVVGVIIMLFVILGVWTSIYEDDLKTWEFLFLWIGGLFVVTTCLLLLMASLTL